LTSKISASDLGEDIPTSGNYPSGLGQDIPTSEYLLPDFRLIFSKTETAKVIIQTDESIPKNR
jgi:hypothetical protein